jgi:hypothetical protein
MLELVPDPVWNTSTGNWSAHPPATTSAAAAAMASATSASTTPRVALTSAAAPLDAGQRRDQRRVEPLARHREVVDRPLGLGRPPRRHRHPDLAHRVVLDPEAVVRAGRVVSVVRVTRFHARTVPTYSAIPMTGFAYTELLPIGPDETPYELVTTDGIGSLEADRTGSSPSSPRCSPS